MAYNGGGYNWQQQQGASGYGETPSQPPEPQQSYPKSQPDSYPNSSNTSPSAGGGNQMLLVICLVVSIGGAIAGFIFARDAGWWYPGIANVLICLCLMKEAGYKDYASSPLIYMTIAMSLSVQYDRVGMGSTTLLGVIHYYSGDSSAIVVIGFLLNSLAPLAAWAVIGANLVLTLLPKSMSKEMRPLATIIVVGITLLCALLLAIGGQYSFCRLCLVNAFFVFIYYNLPVRWSVKWYGMMWFSYVQSPLMGMGDSNETSLKIGGTLAFICLWVFVFVIVSELKGMRMDRFKDGASYTKPCVIVILVCAGVATIGAIMVQCGWACASAVISILFLWLAMMVEGECNLAFTALGVAMLFSSTPYFVASMMSDTRSGIILGCVLMAVAQWVAFAASVLGVRLFKPLPPQNPEGDPNEAGSIKPQQQQQAPLDFSFGGSRSLNYIAMLISIIGCVLWWIVNLAGVEHNSLLTTMAGVDAIAFFFAIITQPMFYRLVLFWSVYIHYHLVVQLCITFVQPTNYFGKDEGSEFMRILLIIGIALCMIAHMMWALLAIWGVASGGEFEPQNSLGNNNTQYPGAAPDFQQPTKPMIAPPQPQPGYGFGVGGGAPSAPAAGGYGQQSAAAPAAGGYGQPAAGGYGAGPAPGGYFNAKPPGPPTGYGSGPAPGGYFNSRPPPAPYGGPR